MLFATHSGCCYEAYAPAGHRISAFDTPLTITTRLGYLSEGAQVSTYPVVDVFVYLTADESPGDGAKASPRWPVPFAGVVRFPWGLEGEHIIISPVRSGDRFFKLCWCYRKSRSMPARTSATFLPSAVSTIST